MPEASKVNADTKNVQQLLDQAREVIDGEMDSRTPEYRAVDLLHQALTETRVAMMNLIMAVEIRVKR